MSQEKKKWSNTIGYSYLQGCLKYPLKGLQMRVWHLEEYFLSKFNLRQVVKQLSLSF